MRRKGERVSDRASARQAERERRHQAEEEWWERLRAHVGEAECARLRQTARRWSLFQASRRIAWLVAVAGMIPALAATATSPSSQAQGEPWLAFPRALLALVFLSAIVARIWAPRLQRRFAQATKDLPPPPGHEFEQAEPRVEDTIAVLDEQWSWARERVGEEQWQLLLGLRDAWLTLSRLLAYARVASYIAAGVFLLGLLGASSLAKQIVLGDALRQPIFVLPVTTLLVTWLARGVIRHLVARELGQLVLQGRNPEAMQRAIWANWQADALRAWQRKEQARAAQPPQAVRPWWRVELSGMHLLLWLALPAALLPFLASVWPSWLSPVAAVAILGWCTKLALLGLRAIGGRKSGYAGAYRWCGTWVGGLAVLVGVPAALFAMGCGLVWLMDIFGR